jgi:hypothetical protein
MLEPGDLIQVSLDCGIQYFKGKLAIVVANMGHDITDHSYGLYYKIQFSDGNQHVFRCTELNLLSKAERKNNNENR